MARRVGETLLAAQRPRGYWNALGATEPSTDITAEMVVWLDAIHQIS
jgi:hypothetical protein